MIRVGDPSRQTLRSIFLMLALLAVAFKVMVPAGFMVQARANDLPFAVVICTSQGAMVVESGQAMPGQDQKPSGDRQGAHDSPCVFAGHGLALAPQLRSFDQAVEFVAYVAPAPAAAVHLAPGRGLAAPPLPARGPPSLLT